MTIDILIVDDHGLMRAGLRALLSGRPGLNVVGEAASGKEAIELACALQPSLVLMDLSLPDMEGLQATRCLLQRCPGLRVLILSMHEDEALVRAALEVGASGYLVKRAADSELVDAIRACAAGDVYVHPAMMRALLNYRAAPAAEVPGSSHLTARETEVLRLIAEGYTNAQIADRLCLSRRTVESHRANVRAKLQLNSRAELVRFATGHGLLDTAKK